MTHDLEEPAFPELPEDEAAFVFDDLPERDMALLLKELDAPLPPAPDAPAAPPAPATETAYTGTSQKISIRISTHVLKRLKATAKARGMPYQTLINQMLAAAT